MPKISQALCSLILRQSEVARTHSLLSPSDGLCLRACSWHHLTIEYLSQSEYVQSHFWNSWWKCRTTTLIGGNIQWSDDFKNKSSNKGHQTREEGVSTNSLGPLRIRSKVFVACKYQYSFHSSLLAVKGHLHEKTSAIYPEKFHTVDVYYPSLIWHKLNYENNHV